MNWDQRGSGKTFGRNGPSTPDMTPERMAEDAIEVAEHVCRQLGKSRLVLVGQSWGALLGLMAVKRRPGLFHAFVGTGQPVSWELTVRDGERWARSQAAAHGDTAGLAALDEADKLPITDLRRIMAMASRRMSASTSRTPGPGGLRRRPRRPKATLTANWRRGEASTCRRPFRRGSTSAR